MGDIVVRYLATGGSTALKGTLRVDADGIGMLFGKRNGSYTWDQVQSLTFDDPGRTKASGVALLGLGVLGLAIRKSFSLVTLTADRAPMYFESSVPIGVWRSLAPQMLADLPVLAGRLIVDGTTHGAPPVASGPPAGFYADPDRSGRTRWWDGQSWTAHYQA